MNKKVRRIARALGKAFAKANEELHAQHGLVFRGLNISPIVLAEQPTCCPGCWREWALGDLDI